MTLPRAIRRSAALALLPALLLAGAGPAGTFFFCHSMQEVMFTSCCPDEEQPADLPTRLEKAACCDQITIARTTVPSDTPPQGSVASPPLAILASAPAVDSRPLAPPPFGAAGRGSTGPPILRVTQALLI